MKSLKYFSVVIMFVIALNIIFVSCKKDDNKIPNVNDSQLKDLVVSPDFDWKTTRSVDFIVNIPSNLPTGVINVTSTDGSITYAKGIPVNNVYTRKLILPKFVSEVNIDYKGSYTEQKTVNVSSGLVNVTLGDNLKSGTSVPWTTTNTGISHNILIPIATVYNNFSISVGDYLAVFYNRSGTLYCGGLGMYNGSVFAVTAWGDDVLTPLKDGFANLEQFTWKIWDASANNVLNAVATYSTGFPANQYYITNSMSGVSSFNVENNDADGDGVTDENDDFPNDPTRAFEYNYPAEGAGTIAFEDLWPSTGDYDFNDLVINYQTKIITNNANVVIEFYIKVLVKAIGASFQNGLGVQFPGIENSWVTSCTGSNLQEGYINLAANGLEAGQDAATIIFFDNASNLLHDADNLLGVNTMPEAEYVIPDDTVTIHVVMNSAIGMTDNDCFALEANPFLIVNLERGHEIHLPYFPPTSLADPSYFLTLQDDSQGGKYYLTENNLPWAFDVGADFDYPKEKAAIDHAYLFFIPWAESIGNSYSDWYKDFQGYRDNNYIYSHN